MRTVTKWTVPEGGGAPLITMPNIPKPLHNCLRGDAEVLTLTGWKRIDSVTLDDTVACWDIDTEKLSWHQPTECIKAYSKQLVRISFNKYKTFGCLTTPEHRLPIRKKSDGRHVVNGQRLKGEKKWVLKETTAAKINLTQFQHFITAARNGTEADNELTDLERVYISIQADGILRRDTMLSTRHNYRYADTRGLRSYRMVFQKERKKRRFVEICKRAGVQFLCQQHSEDSYAHSHGYQRYDVWVEPDCKNFWHCFNIQDFSQKKAQQFIDEAALWDGSCAETCGVLNRRYVTTCLDNAKFIQAVAVIAGVTSSFQVRPEDKEHGWKELYTIDFLDRDFRATQSCKKEVEIHEDDVYCINVPTHFFVARDGDTGSVMITGNCAPRTIMGAGQWDETRKACYEACNRHCEICGAECGPGKMDAHELYDIDYEACTSTFVRLVGLCKKCHTGFIHSGRAITCYRNHVPLWSKDVMLDAARHGFELVHNWNKLHPDAEPLRVWRTFIDWLSEPSLHDELSQMIKEYDIHFYTAKNADGENGTWNKWKLIYNDTEYYSPYEDMAAWAAEMDKNNKQDLARNNLFAGDEFEELRKNIGG